MSNSNRQSLHGEWSSRWVFVLAATGAAVGLGNVWKFPYIAGVNGGAAFVLIYLVFVMLIGVPLLMAEIFLGRTGRRNPALTMRELALESGRSKHWKWVGVIGILSGFLILSYYCVIAGWALDYAFKAASGSFQKLSPEHVRNMFNELISNPVELLQWHTIIILVTTMIVARGVQAGLERSIRLMFPAMVILLLVLLGYVLNTGFFDEGLEFLFKPDFSALTSAGVLMALGHAFFTLSLATGSIMMYGAYLPRHASVTVAAVCIAAADTFVALLSSMIIFPIVFANQLEPDQGPGLIFHTLPLAFSNMPHGTLFATLFFVLLVFAALTSAISLLEPSVAYLVEKYHMSRTKAAYVAGMGVWVVGIGTVLSFNHWADLKLFGHNFFELMDYLTANILLPLGGLFIAIFAAWFMKSDAAEKALDAESDRVFKWWRFCSRYLVPLAILLVFASVVGILKI